MSQAPHVPGPPPSPQPPYAPAMPAKKKPRTLLIVLSAVAGVLVLCIGAAVITALAGGDNQATSPPPVAATATRVADINALRVAVEGAGYPCTGWEIVNNPTGGALQRAQCTDSLTLGTFPDEAAARRSAEAVADMMSGVSSSTHIIGPNWTVGCGDDVAVCTNINKAEALRGSLLTSGEQAATPAALAPTTAAKPAQPAVPTIEDGQWTVGADIPAGKYRTTANVSADCYWAITKSGTNGNDIIANDIPGGGRPQVTLKTGQDFQTERCGTWTKIG